MSRPEDDEPVSFGPGMPHPAPGVMARKLMIEARKAAIVQRVALEVRSIFDQLQEASRTIGIVLGVLRVVDVYPASWWLISTFLAGPFVWNLGVLAVAWIWRPKVLR